MIDIGVLITPSGSRKKEYFKIKEIKKKGDEESFTEEVLVWPIVYSGSTQLCSQASAPAPPKMEP